MRKLHLVGLTTDREGLIFSGRKGSKSGGFVVPLGEELLSAIAELKGGRNGEEPVPTAAIAVIADTARPRPESALTPREMQSRLRAGQTIEEVASEAGVGTDWVDRFAVPILAEQAKMVELALTLTYSKSRLGESSQPLAESVGWNLADRGIFLPEDRFDAGWRAFHLHDSVWIVRFRYQSRGRPQEAAWELDVPAGHLMARDRLASELGYIEKGRRRPVSRSTVHEEGPDDPDGPARPARPRAARRPAGAKRARASSTRRPARGRTRSGATTTPVKKSSSGSAVAARSAVSKPPKATPATKVRKTPASKTAASRKATPATKVRKAPASKTAASRKAVSKTAASKKVASRTAASRTVASKTVASKPTSRSVRPVRTAAVRKPSPGRPGGRRASARTAARRPKRELPSPSSPSPTPLPIVVVRASRPRTGKGTVEPTSMAGTGPGDNSGGTESPDNDPGAVTATNSVGVRQAVAKVTSERLAATRAAPRWQAPAGSPGPRSARPGGGQGPPRQGPSLRTASSTPSTQRRPTAAESRAEPSSEEGPPDLFPDAAEPAVDQVISLPRPAFRPSVTARLEPSGGESDEARDSGESDEAWGSVEESDEAWAEDVDVQAQFVPRPLPGPGAQGGESDGVRVESHRRPTIAAGRVVGSTFSSPQPDPGPRSVGAPPKPLDDRPRRRLRLGRRRDA